VNAWSKPSLNWQEVEVEQRTYRRINNAISNLLKDGEYLVEVDIVVKDPGGPNFNSLNKVGFKISTVDFDDSKGDYIAFSKVGLEVPIVEKLYKENQRSLLEMHRYNESYDLFKNLDTVNIDIFLSDLLSKEAVDRVKNIVNSMKFSFGEVRPKISFEKLKMQIPPVIKPIKKIEKKKIEDTKWSLREILNFISKFGNAIGFILGTILLGLFSYALLRRYFKGMKELQEQGIKEEVDENSSEDEQEEDIEDVAVIDEEISHDTADDLVGNTPEENLDRLKKFLIAAPNDATAMIKKWIHQDTKDYQNSLKVCVQELEDSELEMIYSKLTVTDRDIWRSKIDLFLTEIEMANACQFIAEEVLRETIGPSRISDLELLDMVLSLKATDTISFVKNYQESGTFLLNIISESFLNNLIEKSTSEDMEFIINLGVSSKPVEESDQLLALLKKELSDFLAKSSVNPFARRMIHLIEDLDPEKEMVMYKLLAQREMIEDLERIAVMNIPSSLVFDLPTNILGPILKAYPMDKKVAMLISLNDTELKEYLLAMFAEEGSRSRDVIEMEFEQYQNDEIALRALYNKKGHYVTEFTLFTRGHIALDESSQKEIVPIVKEWINSITDLPDVAHREVA